MAEKVINSSNRSIYGAFALDTESVSKGRWAPLKFNGQSLGRLRLRPTDTALNGEFRAALTRMAQDVVAWQKENPDQRIPDDIDARFLATAYVGPVLTDWEIYDDAGEPVEFSIPVAIDLLVKLPKLFEYAKNASQRWGTYRRDFEADAVKS